MAREMTILVGTVGQGVMRSADSGQSWRRIGVDQGMHSDALVRAVVNHPSHPETVFAGSDAGLYVSEDAGGTWRLLDGQLRGRHVWALAIDPDAPDTMYAGTGTPTPAGVFRSGDGGRTWEQRPVEIAAECINVGTPRVTAIAIDPTAANRVWVGLEVDGLRLSTDSGESWRAVNGGIPNRDVHNVTVTAGPPKTVIVVVNDDIYTTVDDGATWRSVGVRDSFPWGYPRGVLVKPGEANTVFVTIGDTTPGQIGTVMRSTDTGNTWSSLTFPVEPNAAMWVVNAQPYEADVMFAGSRYGYLYRSDDGGESWSKLWREFSEISSVIWVPN
ncbi:MAG: hypothetical protein J4F43_08245 [Dehalococcoidia bacterium]|nr:hypothetical protein [Dehalococcoidia bacterium]